MTYNQVYKIVSNPKFTIIYWSIVVMSYFLIDERIAWWVNSIETPHIRNVADIISDFGLGHINIPLFLIIYLIARFGFKNAVVARKAFFILLAICSSGIICDIFKFTLGRGRPEELIEAQFFGFHWWHFKSSGWSFPSGHATVIASVASMLCYYLSRYYLVWIGLMLAVCASRVLINMHYVSDVMGGLYLGTMMAVFWLYYSEIKKPVMNRGMVNE